MGNTLGKANGPFSCPQASCFPWWWSCTSSGSRRWLTWKATPARKRKTAWISRLLCCTAGRSSWPRRASSLLCSLGYCSSLLGGIFSYTTNHTAATEVFLRSLKTAYFICICSHESSREVVDVTS